MAENWVFYPFSDSSDRTFFVFVDTEMKERLGSDAPTTVCRIRVHYKAPNERGLPEQAEFEPVRKFEDELSSLADAKNCLYVGRTTGAGVRDFYVYIDCPREAWREDVQNLASDADYQVETGFRDEPKHDAYFQLLYPTPEDWQVISDMETIDVFRERGDSGTAPRAIDHWAYFNDKQTAEDFSTWAQATDFELRPGTGDLADDGRVSVLLRHEGTLELADITGKTIALQTKATELGGDYDGWEAPVMVEDPGR